MRANPGGYIAPEETVGRGRLVETIWRRLEGQSVLLTSERRIGKTCVIRVMKSAPCAGDFCVLRDIEGLHSPGEFIESIYTDLEPLLSRGEKAKQKFFGMLEALGGIQVKDLKLPIVQPHWKNLLMAVIGDAMETHKGRVILFWDEMPLFIHNVAGMCGAKEAMTLLDTLRSLRQGFSNLRMVFTGSVGMHQVVEKLRAAGYANAPTNDMAIVEVTPLDTPDGNTLAGALLSGEGIEAVGGQDRVAAAIARAAGYVPFYIHLLVARIHDEADLVDAESVEHRAEELIRDPNDPADFGYFEKRITTYYEQNASLALKVLDVIAASASPILFEDLLNSIQNTFADVSVEQFRQLLVTLAKDHYVHKSEDNRFSFRNYMVQRWWKFARVG